MLKQVFSLYKKFKIYGLKTFCLMAANETWRKFAFQWLQKSYSQKGEDLIIDKLLGHKKKGFYVDVGAYDPYRFSNTKRFYQRGWRGINFEPNFTAYQKFLRARPRDINLNLGILEKPGKWTFYQFFPETLSTFSKKEALKYEEKGFKIIGRLKVEVDTLNNILSKFCRNKPIDFFSIDAEGFDLAVLKSNNWKKYKPSVICIESVGEKKESQNHKKEKYLNDLGYQKFSDNGLNGIYLQKEKACMS